MKNIYEMVGVQTENVVEMIAKPKITSDHWPISAQTSVRAGQTHTNLAVLFARSFVVKNICYAYYSRARNVVPFLSLSPFHSDDSIPRLDS